MMNDKIAPKNEHYIGDVSAIQNGGKGILFSVEEKNSQGQILKVPAFVIKYNNDIYAFKNRCGHIAVTLDFQPGDFFDEDGEFLVCATHGASYAPDTGKCLGGPCYGVGLEKMDITIVDNEIYLDDETVRLVNE